MADDRILEYAREKGSAKATEMAESGAVRFSQPYLSQRCSKLVDHGLLRDLGNGVYVITERGKQYLDGEIDTSEDRPDQVDPEVSEPIEPDTPEVGDAEDSQETKNGT